MYEIFEAYLRKFWKLFEIFKRLLSHHSSVEFLINSENIKKNFCKYFTKIIKEFWKKVILKKLCGVIKTILRKLRTNFRKILR